MCKKGLLQGKTNGQRAGAKRVQECQQGMGGEERKGERRHATHGEEGKQVKKGGGRRNNMNMAGREGAHHHSIIIWSSAGGPTSHPPRRTLVASTLRSYVGGMVPSLEVRPRPPTASLSRLAAGGATAGGPRSSLARLCPAPVLVRRRLRRLLLLVVVGGEVVGTGGGGCHGECGGGEGRSVGCHDGVGAGEGSAGGVATRPARV